MAHYRLYLLDADDHVAGLLESECLDDRDALRTADTLRGPHAAAEVWREELLVGRVGLAYAPFAPPSARAPRPDGLGIAATAIG